MLRHVALTVSLLLAGSSVTSLAKTAAPRAIDQAPGAAAPVAEDDGGDPDHGTRVPFAREG